MYQTGIDLSHRYRETSEGGLAKLYQHKAGTPQ
jgi:L-serine deaminase